MSKEVLFVVSFITKLFQELQSKPGDQTISVFWCFLGGAICWNSCQPGKHPLHKCARNSGASACITNLRVNLKNKSDIKDAQGVSLVCGHLILNPSGPKDYQSNELDGRINGRISTLIYSLGSKGMKLVSWVTIPRAPAPRFLCGRTLS